MRYFPKGILVGFALLGVSAFAQQATPERKPTLNFSIAMPRLASQQTNGALFSRATDAMKSADISDGKNFAGFFAPKAKLLLRTWRDGKLTRVSFTKEVAKAAVKSCVGPLSFDEGRNWVQLSWVCQVNEASPLAEFITFRESSEFALTVWFKNGKIVEGDAGEPLPVPGQRFVPMNAFDQMKARGQ